MQVTPAALDAIFTTFDTRFQGAYQRAEAWSDKVVTQVPSSTRSSTYAWMERLPRFREWIGERVVRNLVARAYTLPNKDWELTVEVARNDIEDDNLGVFAPMLDEMGQSAKKWPDDVMAAVIQAGVAQLAYDGQGFFDTDHPIDMDNSGSGTYANRYTSTPLTPANYAAVRAAMGAILGSDGHALKVTPNLLLVPPQLEQVARTIMNAEIIAPAAAMGGNAANVAVTNTMRGSADVLVVPEFANEAGVWYLLDTTKALKPFIFQLRKAPVFTFLNSPSDEQVFWHKKFIYGADARGNGGYSLPFLAARCEA